MDAIVGLPPWLVLALVFALPAISLVRRRGALAVVLGRWAAALRALVPGIAGMSGMPQGRFTVANIAGGAASATTVAMLGFGAGASYRVLERRLGLASEVDSRS